MPQFPIPSGKKVGEIVELAPNDSKHLSTVLRVVIGEKLSLFDGTKRFTGEIVSAEKNRVTVQLLEEIFSPVLKGEITLCQAMLKKDKMEWVVQKAVELGAARLIPFSSERTIPREIGQSKISRWQKIADEAMKQCGRVTPMTMAPLSNFNELVQTTEKDSLKILFHFNSIDFSSISAGPDDRQPFELRYERSQRADRSPPARSMDKIDSPLRLSFFIGPEGGFSPKEVEAAKQAGCKIASLGSLTLRAETAAIAALTLIQHELGNT